MQIIVVTTTGVTVTGTLIHANPNFYVINEDHGAIRTIPLSAIEYKEITDVEHGSSHL